MPSFGTRAKKESRDRDFFVSIRIAPCLVDRTATLLGDEGTNVQHHVTVKVSRTRFADNIRFLRRRLAPTKICVVMKSDAYGHGLEALSTVAAESGADYIGISTNPEARTVREHLPDIPLLRLRSALPDEYEESVQSLRIEEQIGSLTTAKYLNDLGRRSGNPIPVHLKIDTGMGRSGFSLQDPESLRAVCQMPGLRVVGIMTHLANADAPDLSSAEQQLDDFWRLREALRGSLPSDIITHTH